MEQYKRLAFPGIEVLELSFLKELKNQYENARDNYPDCTIIPPFFWDTSGRATIHGIVTTSMKFIGSDIFSKMMMEPELVKGIHKWITDVYIAVIRHFSKLGDLPVTSVHVGECSGTMLDEYTYREFVTPYISQLGKEFGAIRLHSCGNAGEECLGGLDSFRLGGWFGDDKETLGKFGVMLLRETGVGFQKRETLSLGFAAGFVSLNGFARDCTFVEPVGEFAGGSGNVVPDRVALLLPCLLYTSPSPRDRTRSRMPSSA